jgi:hypothetical protein
MPERLSTCCLHLSHYANNHFYVISQVVSSSLQIPHLFLQSIVFKFAWAAVLLNHDRLWRWILELGLGLGRWVLWRHMVDLHFVIPLLDNSIPAYPVIISPQPLIFAFQPFNLASGSIVLSSHPFELNSHCFDFDNAFGVLTIELAVVLLCHRSMYPEDVELRGFC